MDPIVPLPLDVVVITRCRNGKKTDIKKIDVSAWPECDIQVLLKKLIDTYATTKLGRPYNIDTQKNILDFEFKWMEFQQYLVEYKGITKADWKQHLRFLICGSEQLAIKWR
jgi:hypothetical protein